LKEKTQKQRAASTSLTIDIELWSKFKAYAALKRKTMKEILEEYIKGLLRKEGML
jgi:hypothetical protein